MFVSEAEFFVKKLGDFLAVKVGGTLQCGDGMG